MEKKLNLLGIRKKVILYHTKSLVGITYTVMRPITEEDEKNIDNGEYKIIGYSDLETKFIDDREISSNKEIEM